MSRAAGSSDFAFRRRALHPLRLAVGVMGVNGSDPAATCGDTLPA